jgi:hypothetical protein
LIEVVRHRGGGLSKGQARFHARLEGEIQTVEDEVPPPSMASVLAAKMTTREEWRPRALRAEYSSRLGKLLTSPSQYGKGCQNRTDDAKKH